jgi:hypoxanthine-guanine phosphoribosyltransferase
MNANPKPGQPRAVIPTEQIQKRVREMARQISYDYQGKTIHALALLENGFIFMADLVRVLEVPVICQFIKPSYRREQQNTAAGFLEIFFSHELAIVGQHVLLIEGLVHSGVTSEFLMNDLRGRGAVARPAVGSESAVAAGLLRISGGRSVPGGLWVGIPRTDPSQPALHCGCKLKLFCDLSHGKNSILFPTRRVRMMELVISSIQSLRLASNYFRRSPSCVFGTGRDFLRSF